jgi:Toprim domain/DNA primase catalytic core, N-terminal domain
MDRPKLDFARIKREVSVADVARRYGFELKSNGDGGWLHGECRLPSHESKDSKHSFAVNVKSNYWLCHSNSCQANRGNKRGGDVLMLVRWMDKCEPYEAASKLADWYHLNGNGNGSENKKAPRSATPPSVTSKPSEPEAVVNKPLAFAGFKSINFTHEYLKKRGIFPETAKEFGVGYFAGKSSVILDSHRLVIPVHNPKGELVAYVSRTLDPKEREKYRFPFGFHKSLELFNLHRVGEQASTIILVEGFFGTMKVYQAGFKNVVSLMGSCLSEAQEHLLDGFERIILMLDPDEAGEAGALDALVRLAPKHFVRVVKLTKQPDRHSSEELQSILRPIA